MKNIHRIIGYLVLGIVIFSIDRITKMKALFACQDRLVINQWLSFDLAFNRGISWGFFYSASTPLFIFITIIIGIITVSIAIAGMHRFLAGNAIFGELLVVIGSVSNIIDRFYYKGVIDFIELSWHGYSWPLFNIADMCIVGGIFIMVMEYYTS